MPAVPIKVPSVGESITEGTVSRWLKPDGATVQSGEPILELETEKATSLVPAPGSGVLKISVSEGQTVAVGATVGTIDPSGAPAPSESQPSSLSPARAVQPSPPRQGPHPQGRDGPREQSSATSQPSAAATVSGSPGKAPAASHGVGDTADADADADAVDRRLAPSVRRLVAEQGVDVARVAGTGPDGRVTKGDVLSYLGSSSSAPASSPPPAPSDPASVAHPVPPWPKGHELDRSATTAAKAAAAAPAATATATSAPSGSAVPVPDASPERETRRRMSGLRRRIAQRLVEAQQTAAILTTFNEADLSRVMELRALYKEPFQKAHGTALGFMSFFVKASIEALKAFPAVNARIEGDEIVYPGYYDIGVAVSTERGLMVPVIRDADRLSFAGIEKAIAGFAARARDATIAVDDLRGGTFTITNGGIYGSLLSTPILNPPQSGILGMHAIKNRPVVVDDQIVIRPMMYLALSYDHRLIDGREAVSFLVRVKDVIENPERLMLGV